MWQHVLGLPQVGVEDNFPHGGDSLSAIKLVKQVREQVQIDLPVALLFEHKTIAAIAARLSEQALVMIEHVEQAHYPLSFAQARMFFIERFEGGSAYHMPALMRSNRLPISGY